MDSEIAFFLARDIQVALVVIFVGSDFFLLFRGRDGWLPFAITFAWLLFAGPIWAFVAVPPVQPSLIIPEWLRSLSPQTATHFLLLVDLLGVATLVWFTGGSERSCFSPLYFMLPIFTLLLLNYGSFLVAYCITTMGAFALTLFPDRATPFFQIPNTELQNRALAAVSRILLWLISGICLGFAIYLDVNKASMDTHHTSGFQSLNSSAQKDSPIPRVVPTPIASNHVPLFPTATPPNARTILTPTINATMAPSVTPVPTATATPEGRVDTSIQSATDKRHQTSPNPPRAKKAAKTSRLTSQTLPHSTKTYSGFLDNLRDLDLKTARQQRVVLAGFIGKRISWEVDFEQYRLAKGEILVFFGETEQNGSRWHRPVRLAKASRKFLRIVQDLQKGTPIKIEGTLKYHSAFELFVAASSLALIQTAQTSSTAQ
jgi:hypothetical protein